jgi:CHAT domain-containing protein
MALNNLAVLTRHMGEPGVAEGLVREALEIRREVLGPNHPDVSASLNALAEVVAGLGRDGEALDLLDEAAAIDDRLMSDVFSIGGERQRLGFLATLEGTTDGYLSIARRRAGADAAVVGRAFDFVLRRKAIGAEASAAQRDALLSDRYADLAPRLEELRSLRTQIVQHTLAGPGPDGPEEHGRILREWERRKEGLEGELAGAIPEIRLDERLRRADRAAVAGVLPPGAALIEFVRFNEFDFAALPARGDELWKPARYVAFVLSAAAPDGRLVDLGEADRIDRLIAAYRDAVTGEGRTRGLDAADAPAAAARSPGAALREAVFDPLVEHLHDATRLFLAPDGDLTRLPFEVLPTADARIIDTYTISYLSTGRDVVRFAVASEAAAGPPLVAAAPDFDLGAGERTAAPTTRMSRDLDPSTIHFDPLAGTLDEGEGIGKLLGVSPWLAEAVLERPLKAARSPRIVHLATHGYFLPDQPREPAAGTRSFGTSAGPLRGPGMENPLLRSGLALAGANTFLHRGALPEEAEDGILTAEDVSGLDLLGTELVVLSACETGLGEVRRGEGVFGLRRAFVLAGARTLVMSLWKVPDTQSAELMQRFYENLATGLPRAEALRAAQLELAARYPHPWFWGAFICQGDPGPLEGIGRTADSSEEAHRE